MNGEIPGPNPEKDLGINPENLGTGPENTESAGLEEKTKEILEDERSAQDRQFEELSIEKVRQDPDFQKRPLKPLVEKYYNSSSASHAIQCASSRAVYARFIGETLEGVIDSDKSTDEDKKLAEEILPDIEFQGRLNTTLSELMITDLLTYKQVYDPSLPPELKITLIDHANDRQRGSYPIVSRQLQELKPALEKLQPELKERLEKMRGRYKMEFEDSDDAMEAYGRFASQEGNVGDFVEEALTANETGDAEKLDRSMKWLIGYFSDGAFILEETLSAHSLNVIRGEKT